MPDDILDVAQGDTRMADFIRQVLVSLAKHGSDTMREMAEEVLSGGTSLRELAAGGVYGDEVGAAFEQFWDKYQKMSPSERGGLEKAGCEYLAPLPRRDNGAPGWLPDAPPSR